MQLKTILNFVEKHRSFVYGAVELVNEPDEAPHLTVEVRPRKNGWPICSGCERPGPGYDRLEVRRFTFVPLWGIAVYLLYAMRRVDCECCGVVVEKVPWADGKHQATHSYRWFLARWAKRLSWSEVAAVFRTNWDTVYRAVQMAVEWGRAHMSLEGVESIGVDEIAWKRGHKYDGRLPDRRHVHPPAVGRPAPQGQDAVEVLPMVRRRPKRPAALHLLGHVEALPQGHRA